MAAPAPGAMPADLCGTILAMALSPRRRRLRVIREPGAHPDNLSMRVIEFRVSAQWVLARMVLGEDLLESF